MATSHSGPEIGVNTMGGICQGDNLTDVLTRLITNGSLLPGLNCSSLVDFNDVFQEILASLYTYDQPKNIVLISIYVPVFLLAFLGNMLVIVVILSNRSMRSVTNYFLLNLAVADLLVTLVCIPLTVGEMTYKAWIYGLVLCKATGYLQGVSIAASVLTIMGLALDRYLALSHPVKARRLSTPEHAKKVLILIWLIAGSIMIPLVFMRQLAIHPLDPDRALAFCHERWPGPQDRRVYDVFLFVFIYVFPGVVVVTSYATTGCHLLTGSSLLRRQNSDTSQNCRILAGRRRVARMLLALAGLFAGSWLPYHIVSLYVDFIDKQTSNSKSLAALSFALLLGHSHSAQNPILYCIMNSSLKRAMMGTLICRQPANDHSRSGWGNNSDSSFARRLTNSFWRSFGRRSKKGSTSSDPRKEKPTKMTPLLQRQKSGTESEKSFLNNETAIVIVPTQGEDVGTPPIHLAAIFEEGGKYKTVIDGRRGINNIHNEISLDSSDPQPV